ncbi:class I SAM-dependent methyltransferase (plasmid) [Pedobacter sp. BS3]|uniref:class I SAM-dependent methyltransferase n=1 Tax=Pedobacter sp. BS3 TaxID=2567937 RepID=UPI0011EEBB9F|nr:class I SAM-dependent methyltransferase [Pedobacter sp. BS3]TZF85828.1 class I SAM-dependent methyltransferase [Pedobacter sp. BS3]
MKKYYPVSSLLNIRKLRALLSFGIKGYLAEIGWFNAFTTKSPVDSNNRPIPWVTYSFIDFIEPRLTKDMRVFEFGSGNSTFFYASRVAGVVSVEHDKNWHDKITSSSPENARMIFCNLEKDGDYAKMPLNLDEKFDIIIVDGRDRVNCCKHAVEALTDSGVIILDDSEREYYSEAIAYLQQNGFKHISFSGISPGFFYRKATSVFYREHNCLNI